VAVVLCRQPAASIRSSSVSRSPAAGRSRHRESGARNKNTAPPYVANPMPGDHLLAEIRGEQGQRRFVVMLGIHVVRQG